IQSLAEPYCGYMPYRSIDRVYRSTGRFSSPCYQRIRHCSCFTPGPYATRQQTELATISTFESKTDHRKTAKERERTNTASTKCSTHTGSRFRIRSSHSKTTRTL